MCYKAKGQQWKESKNEIKKEQRTKIHDQTITKKTGIKDTNWKKKRRKKWYICACYTMKHTRKVAKRAYQGYGNCERKIWGHF